MDSGPDWCFCSTAPSADNQQRASRTSREAPEAEVFVINPKWTTLYLNYLLNDELPKDRAEAEHIARCSRRYVVVGGEELYHRSASGMLMRCISEEDGRKLLKEIHSRNYGNHATS